jgi:uncharacterized protein (UPF0332 family)
MVVTLPYGPEIAANWERAERSLQAAKDLAARGYYDIAASRAYYAAFYAATAVLLCTGLAFNKHSGVIAAVHQHLVKPGKLDQQQGKALNLLFELRGVGDYGATVHVSETQATHAIRVAADFLHAIEPLLPSTQSQP